MKGFNSQVGCSNALFGCAILCVVVMVIVMVSVFMGVIQ